MVTLARESSFERQPSFPYSRGNDMNAMVKFGGVALAASLFGCSSADDGGIDQAMLAQYRAAVPSKTQIQASSPEASSTAKVGDPAIYPTGSQDIVVGINGSVGYVVDAMKTIVSIEPSLYDSEKKEFFWGPYPAEDGFGTVAAFIKDAGAGEDFRYHYALLRGVNNDIASMKVVIWGGANPDPASEEHGSGVTLWDFEANYEFEKANNPAFDTLALDRGRFVAVYGKGANDKGELTLVVAALRGFVPKDKPMNPPGDLDYFYGALNDGTNRIDFVDWESAFNVDDDPAKALVEDVGVHMAFLNEGTGRAEATASGGDLASGQAASAVECWDKALAQTYLSFETSTNSVPDGPPVTDGVATDCGLFQGTLADLGVPALSDVDPALRAALDEVATNGVPQ
jgi:hypothetical protein